MAKLALIRHGESEWNAKDLWTGWMDIGLSQKGHEQAKEAAEKLKGIHWDIAFESLLIRSKQTLDEIKKVLGYDILTFSNFALNERSYGDYTGKNKFDIERQVGHVEFVKIRRGWDTPIPNGESLKDVYNRVVPYYLSDILPKLKEGKNVIISAHGNSLRALVKYLDNISDEEIQNFELPTGEIKMYDI